MVARAAAAGLGRFRPGSAGVSEACARRRFAGSTQLAARTDRRLNVRLVKGAYWDTEVKRAQERGLAGYPVFTRKVNTDVSYVACARALIAAGPTIYPQFATHNAQTVATIIELAAEAGRKFEFQRLHGMGEELYAQIVGAGQSQHSVPRLCAGRFARRSAALSGAAAARERREHFVRQSHRR